MNNIIIPPHEEKTRAKCAHSYFHGLDILICGRSLIEPVRRLLSRLGGYYLEGRADDIDFENQLVEVGGVNDSDGRKFYGKLSWHHRFSASFSFGKR